VRTLEQQWEAMSPPAMVGREAELRALVEALKRPGSIAELVAQVGMGKTTLLKKLAHDYAGTFDGAIEYFGGNPSFQLTEAVTAIAERFRAASGHSLLIVDGADLADPGQTLEGIRRLETGPWQFSTVLASYRELGLGTPIRLQPLNAESFVAFLDRVFDGKLDPETMKKLWTATGGNPRLARVLEDQWRTGHVPDVSALAALLSPWHTPGLVGTDGQPLRAGGERERRIITDVRVISDAFLRQVADDPRLMFEMPPRRFEEFVAELLERHGYTVTLTPQTRDGGKDMYAARRDDVGSFLYVVECKRHAPDRPVGVGVVRALHGVAQHERVNAAMVMTTSYFSAPAREFADDLRYQVSLKDYLDLRHWLDRYRSGA
jgi:restriction system protein